LFNKVNCITQNNLNEINFKMDEEEQQMFIFF
jgi:hypothetical protein